MLGEVWAKIKKYLTAKDAEDAKWDKPTPIWDAVGYQGKG
jgi:hypothetical protein